VSATLTGVTDVDPVLLEIVAGSLASIELEVETAIGRCERDATSDAGHLAGNRDAELVRRVASEMEEPEGDYLTLDMTGDVDALAGQSLDYIEEQAR